MLIKLLSSRNAQGWTEFLYLWGPPGAGKIYLLKQLAKALGVKAYPFPCGPTAAEGRYKTNRSVGLLYLWELATTPALEAGPLLTS